MSLAIGTQAPDFNLPSTSGRSFQLSKDLVGKPCILYFYPKDFTPGCTQEACDFRDHFSYFEGLEIDIFGISKDSVESHLKFKETHQLPFQLLSDTKGEVAKKYEALVSFLGITRRITYLLDQDHKIVAVYENMFGAGKHIQKMVQLTKAGRHS